MAEQGLSDEVGEDKVGQLRSESSSKGTSPSRSKSLHPGRFSLRGIASNVMGKLRRSLTTSLRPHSLSHVALEVPVSRARSETPDLLQLDTSRVQSRLSISYPAMGNYDVLRFDVVKVRSQTKKQKRIIEINSKKMLLTNYDGRNVRKEFSIAQIEKVEILDRKEKEVVVHFLKSSNKPYHLKFSSKLDRDMFVDLLRECLAVLMDVEESQSKHGTKVPSELAQLPLLLNEGFDSGQNGGSGDCVNLRLFVTTFNVGDAPPPAQFDGWLPSSGSPYDIIVIGVQECSYKHSSEYVDARDHFEKKVRAHVGEDYYLLSKSVHWDRALIIYMKKKLQGATSSVETDYVATGIAGILGNKGGMAAKFRVHGHSFCFINSHLAAHAKNLDARNANYKEIVSSLKLGRKQFDVLHQFHHVVWVGDLNYRVSMKGSKAVKLIETCMWEEMLEKDQLRLVMRRGEAFSDFNEGKIDFAPTFRLSRKNGAEEDDDDDDDDDEREAVAADLAQDSLEVNISDVAGEESDGGSDCEQELVRASDATRPYCKIKTRTPSWCDRILWKSLPGCTLHEVDLFSCQNIITSDHCPVAAVFNTSIPLPPIKQGVAGEVNIVFERLEAFVDAGFQSSINLYMKFFANFLEKPYPKTPVCKRRVGVADFEWSSSSVPALKPYSVALNVLDTEYVFLLLRDDNGKKGHNSIVGQAVIYLKGITSKQPLQFDANVSMHGQQVGRVRGSLRLHNA